MTIDSLSICVDQWFTYIDDAQRCIWGKTELKTWPIGHTCQVVNNTFQNTFLSTYHILDLLLLNHPNLLKNNAIEWINIIDFNSMIFAMIFAMLFCYFRPITLAWRFCIRSCYHVDAMIFKYYVRGEKAEFYTVQYGCRNRKHECNNNYSET